MNLNEIGPLCGFANYDKVIPRSLTSWAYLYEGDVGSGLWAALDISCCETGVRERARAYGSVP